MSESAFDEFEIDDGDEKIESRQSKYQVEPDQPDIVSLCWVRGISDDDFKVAEVESHIGPRFIGCSKIWIEKVGNVIIKKDDRELKKYVDAHVKGDARDRVATVIVKWPVTRDGNKVNIDEVAFKAGKYQVLPWEFGPDKYQSIRNTLQLRHEGGNPKSLFSHDLNVSLSSKKEKKYQDFTVACRNQGLLRGIFKSDKMTSLKERLLTDIRDCITTLMDKKKSCMGAQLTVADIRSKLNSEDGGGGGGGGDDDVSDDSGDIDSLLEGV